MRGVINKAGKFLIFIAKSLAMSYHPAGVSPAKWASNSFSVWMYTAVAIAQHKSGC